MKSLLKGGLVAAAALSFSFGAAALDHHGKKKKNMKDPMARAEMQCQKAKKAAEAGSDEEKKSADAKCAKAMEKAKALMAKEMKAKKVKKDDDGS